MTIPADGSTLNACPFAGVNPFSQAVKDEMLALAGEASVAAWNRHPHAPKEGFEPLELYTK